MTVVLGNFAAVVVVCTRPRAIPLAMITMGKSIDGFPLLSYRAPLGDLSGRRRFAKNLVETRFFVTNFVSLVQIGFYLQTQ